MNNMILGVLKMKFTQILFCSAVLFSAVNVQAAESSSPPLPDCSGLTGQERSLCQVHGIAHTNCVAKGITTVEAFVSCLKAEIGEIMKKRFENAKSE